LLSRMGSDPIFTYFTILKNQVMKILVVGGAGYIGSHCVRQIIQAGHDPVVLDNLEYGHRGAIAPDIPFYDGDLGDESFVLPILQNEDIEIVMHFAAYAAVGESVEQPLRYYLNNVAATLHLLNTMKQAGVKKFVFSSTCATFGVPDSLPISESFPQKPINPYGQTKLDIENVLKAHALAEDFRFAVFRYFNAAGANEEGSIGEDHYPELHVIPLAIEAATGKREYLKVFGTDYPTPDGTCLRDYVHVDDLSRAHISAFELLDEPGTQLFLNRGVGKPSSVREVVAAVEKVSGKTVPVEYSKRRPGDPPALYADATLAKETLGWEPQYDNLESIVASAWKWHSTHPNGFED
jgi:UDP-glucose 4-epimerase